MYVKINYGGVAQCGGHMNTYESGAHLISIQNPFDCQHIFTLTSLFHPQFIVSTNINTCCTGSQHNSTDKIDWGDNIQRSVNNALC